MVMWIANRKSILIATGIAIQIAVGLTMHDGHPGYFFEITGSGIFNRIFIGNADGYTSSYRDGYPV